jgi:hypothetical protein
VKSVHTRQGEKASGAAEAGSGKDAGLGDAAVQKTLSCGTKTCKLPADSTLELCCMDLFTSACGMLIGGSCSPMRSDEPTSCPLPSLPHIATATGGANGVGGISACCAGNNECGLDLGVNLGCSNYATACSFLPQDYRDLIEYRTCDGDAIPQPDACKSGKNSSGD